MKYTFGPVTTLFDGYADDADSSDGPPGSYSSPSPGGCADAATNAYASNLGSTPPGWFYLSARGNGQAGPNVNHLGKVLALASTSQSFAVVPSWNGAYTGGAVLNWLAPKTSTLQISVNLVVKANLAAAVGDVTFNANIFGGPPTALGFPLTLNHTYGFAPNSSNSAQTNVKKDGVLVGTISNPGMYHDNFATPPLLSPFSRFLRPPPPAPPSLGAGSYLLDITLDVSEQFEDRGELMAIASVFVQWY